jgi:hypothetical protein
LLLTVHLSLLKVLLTVQLYLLTGLSLQVKRLRLKPQLLLHLMQQ